MVRFWDLRLFCRGDRRELLPGRRSCLLDARRFCRVRGRLPRPPAGRRPVRPCRRPDRAQAGAHGVGGVDGRADRPDRPAADARADRRPRGGGARVPAAAAGPSRRRRVPELDHLCRRALRRAAARPGRQLDGGGRHHRHPARLGRWRADIERAVGRHARRVGLAHPLPAWRRRRRGWPLAAASPAGDTSDPASSRSPTSADPARARDRRAHDAAHHAPLPAQWDRLLHPIRVRRVLPARRTCTCRSGKHWKSTPSA